MRILKYGNLEKLRYVVHEKNGKPTNLLAAYADTPLKVSMLYPEQSPDV